MKLLGSAFETGTTRSVVIVVVVPNIVGVVACPLSLKPQKFTQNTQTTATLIEMENLSNIAACPICLELKTNQVLLPCGHSFCLDDLSKQVNSKNNKCSLCQKEFPEEGLNSFVKNYDRNSLAEVVIEFKKSANNSFHPEVKPLCDCKKEATVYCIDDEEFFCEEHNEKIHSCGKLKTHTRISPSKTPSIDPICTAHRKMRLDKWCTKCSVAVCLGK